MQETCMNIAGYDFYLMYNGAAMYNLREKLCDKKIYEAIATDDVQSFYALCDILAEMIAQGELYRRWMGFDKGKIVTSATLRVILRPVDIPAARQAVLDAFVRGMRSETPENEDIDLGLQELEAKNGKKKVSPERSTSTSA